MHRHLRDAHLKHVFTPRVWIASAFALLCMLALGVTSPLAGSGSARQVTVSALTPHRGGTLVFARNLDVQSLDPFVGTDNGSIFAKVQVYDTLVEANAKGGVSPGLASSWKASSGGLTWTFHLRRARFSNGTPLTAQDVKFSLDRFMNPKVNTVLYALANGFKSVQVVNPHTVAIHLSHPVGALLDNISVFPAMIVNKKLVQQNPTAYYKNPVATGAFKVKSWVPGSHITLERNPYYWKKGKPYLDQIRFDYVPDDNARILRVKAGTAELAEAIPYSQIKSLSRQKKFKIETQQIGSWQGVFLNHRVHPYDDINVRKALNYATDKAAIDEAVYGGAAKIANDMLPSTSLTAPFSKVAPYSYNLTRAKQLMAASSVPNGFSATLIYPAGSTVHQELATVLQAEWAQIGVKVTVQAADGADAVKRFITPPGDYQMIIPFTQFTADVTAPDEIPSVYYAGGVAKTRTGWSPPQSLIDLVNQGSSTVNPKDRVKIWTAEQRAAMNQAPWVTLFFLPAVTAVSNQVHGFRTLPAAWWNLENVWLSK